LNLFNLSEFCAFCDLEIIAVFAVILEIDHDPLV
jgi:hypothetical protein